MAAARSLCFDADGLVAAIVVDRGVHLVDLADRASAVFHAIDRPLDVVAVGGELWVASATRLHRFDRDRKALETRELAGGDGVLYPTATGEPAALWSGAPLAIVSPSGAQTPIPLATEQELVLPISRSRWVVCLRDRVALRDLGTERWAISLGAGGRVVDGAVLFGGRAIALVVESGGALARMIVVGAHDGAIQHRLALHGIDRIRFARERGFALMRLDSRRLVVIDLRFGHVLREHAEDTPIVDLAIDGAAQSFLVRFGAAPDDVVLGSIRALVEGGGAPRVGAEPAIETTPIEPPAPPPTPDAAPFYRGNEPLGRVELLSPRVQRARAPLDAVLALLERYRELVSALAGGAIARAWDEGRISAPVDGGLPFYSEVAGLRGRSQGRAPDDVAEARREVDAALAAMRTQQATFGAAATPLAALATEFGLSNAAQLVLLVTAAPSLWGELARLYGILSNDVARPLVDELLLVQILDPHASRTAIAAELDRDAPLVRNGLVQLGGGTMRPFLPLVCDAVVLRLLRGADCEVELQGMHVVTAARAFDELLVPAATKTEVARRVAMPASPGRIVVRGRSGSGRHALLAVLAEAAGRRLAVVDATPILRDLRQRAETLGVALHRANLVGLLPCVDGLENLPADDPAAREVVAKILDDHPGPLALRLPPDVEPPLRPGHATIDLPPLTMDQRMTCWRVLLAEHELNVPDLEELADKFRVGPAVITRACAAVAGPDAATSTDASLALEKMIRQHLELKLRATATRVERLASWSRVILPPDIQESVLELIARIKHRRTVYDKWGMGDVLSSMRGVTALFQGGPGTGKTLVASAIANELGMDLYRVDLSRIMSKWIGETEQNLAKLFDAAEDGHTIVLFDEADSLFAKRTEVRSSVDRYANLEVNYLLQRLDTFEGIAILTTNFGTAIDSAFKRRLSFRLTFPFPDEEAREALWRSHLPQQLPRMGPFDLGELARKYRLSGGYIRNAALRAAFIAAEEHSALTQHHIERAIKAEFREIGKIAESGTLE
jgi:hypothetical protein